LVLFFYFILLLLFYSYFIYPSSLLFFLKNKAFQEEISSFQKVNLVIAAYNEEKGIEDTLQTIFESDFDFSNFMLYVGNDGSNDQTSDILENWMQNNQKIVVENFDRIGKGNVLNAIIEKYQLNTSGQVIVFMDANIAIDKKCLKEMVHHLKNYKTGMVGASVMPKNKTSNAESMYILRENRIKSNESKAFDIAVGVFGACFGIRGELYRKIPENFITDDLYTTLSVIRQGYKITYSEEIQVYEDIQADVQDEFNRKKRFAAGNFQILYHFRDLLNPFRTKIGHMYAYFFHKIVRWVAPVLLFGIFIYSLLVNNSQLFFVVRLSGIIIIVFLLINYQLYKQKRPLIAARFFYFFMMNLAILCGFINYLKGIKSNVWERSERN
jgi:cellulose synthase/poly-beta-1,6-N-acetylglucosamine synthase-like glycosyltransferase